MPKYIRNLYSGLSILVKGETNQEDCHTVSDLNKVNHPALSLLSGWHAVSTFAMSHHPVSQMQLSCIVGHSLRKQPTFHDTIAGFPAKWHLRNKHRNSILMTRHYPEQGSASVWSCHKGDSLQTNQKHYPDLGSDASSEWSEFLQSFLRHHFEGKPSDGVTKCLFSQAV